MKELIFGMAVGLVTGAALASYNKQIKDLMKQAKKKIDDLSEKLCTCKDDKKSQNNSQQEESLINNACWCKE